ncbi:MAG TPA: LysM peptidoglycan-binding domain-containing protein [Actinomycetota bacterium]|nr:LysM peptidoglycan-binding domain-containing protein [Actinomycetota bacterium]
MARTRVRRRRIAILLVGAVVVGLWSGPVANALDGSDRAGAQTGSAYVVRPGDTLWSIARRVAPGRDPRPVVDAIAAANDVQAGALLPGQTLSIPA